MSIAAFSAETSASSFFKFTAPIGARPSASTQNAAKPSEPVISVLDAAAAKAEDDAVVIRAINEALEADKERQDYLKLGEEASKKAEKRDETVSLLKGDAPAKGLTRPAFAKDDAFSFKSAEAVYSEVRGDGFSARSGTLQTASVTPSGVSFSEVNVSEAQIKTDTGSITVRTLSITEAYAGRASGSPFQSPGSLFSRAA